MIAYPMIVMPLSEEDGGGFEALFPDLPGCASDGPTPEAAVAGAMETLRAWEGVQRQRGAGMPAPFSALDAHRHRDEELIGALRSMADYTEAVEGRIAALEARLDAALGRNQDEGLRLLPLMASAHRQAAAEPR